MGSGVSSHEGLRRNNSPVTSLYDNSFQEYSAWKENEDNLPYFREHRDSSNTITTDIFDSKRYSGNQKDSPVAFSSLEYRSFPIVKIEEISHNTKLFSIALPTPQHRMGLTASSFLFVRGKQDHEFRPYTPINTEDDRGECHLLIKRYNNGVVSSYLHSLKVGDKVEIKGPITKFTYRENMKREIGLIAGGTGLTPMLQLTRAILSNTNYDRTIVRLLVANHSEQDILLKDTLDMLSTLYPKQFFVQHILSQPSSSTVPTESKYLTGHITAEVIAQTMPAPADDILLYVCGPSHFLENICGNKSITSSQPAQQQGKLQKFLKQLGYTEEMVYKF